MKLEIKVETTREQVSAINKVVMSAEPVKGGCVWKARFSDTEKDKVAEVLKKKLDKKQEYKPYLYDSVYSKMKMVRPKTVGFSAEMLKPISEVLEAFCVTLIKETGMDKYKPAQKTIKEATDEELAKENAKVKKKKNASANA